MKTNRVMELLKAKGIGVEVVSSSTLDTIHQQSPLKRKRLYQSPTPDLPLKSEQSQNKLRTNSEQEPPKLRTNLEQTQNKVGTSLTTKSSISTKSQNKVRSQPRTEPRTNLEQTQNKVGTKYPFSSVVGLQRRILLFVFEATKTSRDRLTAPIAIRNLAYACQTTTMAAQVTTRRLEQKGFLIRGEYKDGRGGWTRYEIQNETFQELLQLETQNKVGTNIEQTQNKVRSQPRTQPRTNLLSSSSINVLEDLKTTTTSDPISDLSTQEAEGLKSEWKTLDFSSLRDIGFTPSHMLQIALQGKITPRETQESIDHFSFDLKANRKAKELNKSPINFFMGILKKGVPYAPPHNYESPEEEARRNYLESIKKREEKRVRETQEIQELHFREWEARLDPTESIKILPEFARSPGQLQSSCLRNHFEEYVWPELSKQVPGLRTRSSLTTDIQKQD